MRTLTACILLLMVVDTIVAQQSEGSNHPATGSTSSSEGSSLPIAKVGKDDLIAITVYDSPELTRSVRVSSEGDIRLPMLKQHIHVAGEYPSELETAIASALKNEGVLVDPIVTVSVVEYRSRAISVSGAVRKPITFQATGTVTLLDAISEADGISETAGAEILVGSSAMDGKSTSTSLLRRISIQDLMNAKDPSLNILLEGGERISVPEAGRVFVLGNVKKPGAYYITQGGESSVMKALSLSEGLESYSSHTAYIYRKEGSAGGRSEIPIELKKITDRKSPDVPLLADDIFYIPSANGVRASLRVLETTLGIGSGVAAAAIYAFH